jgi:hypothetical protein
VVQALNGNSLAVVSGHAPISERDRAGAGRARPDEL